MGSKQKKRPPSAKRLATEQRLVDAVGTILKESGVRGLGVNRVATVAGVDKALIYRYFGDLTGLLKAYGESGAFWPELEELVGSSPSQFAGLSFGKLAATVLSNYAKALSKRPVTLALLAWECVETTPLTEALEEVRERRSEEIFVALKKMGVPIAPHIRTAALLFSAAMQYLVIRRDNLTVYGGLKIGDDKGWKEIIRHVEKVFDAMAPPE